MKGIGHYLFNVPYRYLRAATEGIHEKFSQYSWPVDWESYTRLLA